MKALNDFIEGQLIQKGIFFSVNSSKNIHTELKKKYPEIQQAQWYMRVRKVKLKVFKKL